MQPKKVTKIVKFFSIKKLKTYLQKFGKHRQLHFGYLNVALSLHEIVDEFGVRFH